MTISEAIEQLQKAKRQLGDVDLCYISECQFQDIVSIAPMAKADRNTEWCWAGPVAIVTLDLS